MWTQALDKPVSIQEKGNTKLLFETILVITTKECIFFGRAKLKTDIHKFFVSRLIN